MCIILIKPKQNIPGTYLSVIATDAVHSKYNIGPGIYLKMNLNIL